MVYAKICDKMYLHRYKMTIEVEMHILWYNEPGFTAHYFTFVSGAFYVNSASLNILRAPGCGFGERRQQLKCSWGISTICFQAGCIWIDTCTLHHWQTDPIYYLCNFLSFPSASTVLCTLLPIVNCFNPEYFEVVRAASVSDTEGLCTVKCACL